VKGASAGCAVENREMQRGEKAIEKLNKPNKRTMMGRSHHPALGVLAHFKKHLIKKKCN